MILVSRDITLRETTAARQQDDDTIVFVVLRLTSFATGLLICSLLYALL